MSPPSQSTLAAFYRSVIGSTHGKPAEERGLKCDDAVSQFMNVDGNGNRVGTATLCGRADDTTRTQQGKMHNHLFATIMALTFSPFERLP